ncbi:MAG: hypothetical protein ACFCA4_01170 [Cyanophyceae cyanobacterium]
MKLDSQEDALDFVNALLDLKGYERLTNIQSAIFQHVWSDPRKTYKDIAERENYEYDSIKSYGARLYQRLSLMTGEKISKRNLRETFNRLARHSSIELHQSPLPDPRASTQACFPQTDSDYQATLEADHVSNLSNRQVQSRYRDAERLMEVAGKVDSLDSLNCILSAFNIYRQLEDAGAAARILLAPIQSEWDKNENAGKIAYRLGLFSPMIEGMNWLIGQVESGCYLPASKVAYLYNENADLIWMSQNNTLASIELHKKSQAWAYKGGEDTKHLIVLRHFNETLCNIDSGNLDLAKLNLLKARQLFLDLFDKGEDDGMKPCLDCLLNYIDVRLCGQSAVGQAEDSYHRMLGPHYLDEGSAWDKNYLPIYVAKALHDTGRTGPAFDMYVKAKNTAIASGCRQVECKALQGLANLCFEESPESADKSIHLLLQAQKIFRSIQAEGDVAQVQLSLGRIYKTLGQVKRSEACFAQTEAFYRRRKAPLMVDQVKLIREGARLIA